MHVFLLFPRFSQEHLTKDVFLFPYYIAKQVHGDVSICYDFKDKNIDFLNYAVNAEDLSLNGANHLLPFSLLKQTIFIIKNRKKIDFLILFHYRWYSLFLGYVYKFFKKDGLLYIKSDMPYDEAVKLDVKNIKISALLKKIIYKFTVKYVDAISFETRKVYDYIVSSKSLSYIHDKAIFIPNGYVETSSQTSLVKEKIFLTVGRIGTYQKNTEFLLEVIELLDLKDWSFYLLGPITSSFKIKIDNFFVQNPHLIDKVFFEGEIDDILLKNKFYERAKVFVLPSRFESYGLVLLEAAVFNDYIISTDVGAINDLINIYGCKGEILKSDRLLFKSRLQCIIDNDISEVENNLNSLRMNSLAKKIMDFIM